MYLCPTLPTSREWLFHRSFTSSLSSILDFLLGLVHTARHYYLFSSFIHIFSIALIIGSYVL
uniref:Uncharacterized protein n=1 Tax=Arundo donax TaxID=35708 RepID=A0A0A9FFL7_ARUDO